MDNPVKSFIDGKLWIPNANNLIICGNLGEVRQESYFLFLNEVKNHYKRVFIVLGDQEFFFCDIDTITDKIKDFCMYSPNVYFLNDTMYDFGKIVILGTTLWADVNLANSQHLSTKYQHIKKDKYNNPHHMHVTMNSSWTHYLIVPPSALAEAKRVIKNTSVSQNELFLEIPITECQIIERETT
jgi:hypothetical protein